MVTTNTSDITERWSADQLVDASAAIDLDVVSMKENDVSRGDLSDKEWNLLESLLPPERGREGRPANDNRIVLNGILWRLRTGAPWREMPDRYGKWNSVYRRYSRWTQGGIWGPVAILLAQMLMLQGDQRERGAPPSRKLRPAARPTPKIEAPTQAKRQARRRGR
jgi:transposase